MSFKKMVLIFFAITCMSGLTSADQLVTDVKIKGVLIGYFGMNSFFVQVDADGPGSGPCKSAWVGFMPENWPYPANSSGADTAQFDRVFSLLMTAYTNGMRVSIVGLTADCNSAMYVNAQP